MHAKPFGPDRRWIRITRLTSAGNGATSPRKRQRLAFEYTMSRYVLRLRLQLAEKLLPFLVGCVLVIATESATRAASGGVAKSIHDFSKESWTLSSKSAKQAEENGVCGVCHQAHNIGPPIVPLWSHQTCAGPFTAYQSPTMIAEVGQPNGPSLACLSCHDGTVAVNQVVGKRLTAKEAVTIPPESLIPPDLHTLHPVSFAYDSSLAANNGSLEDPTTYHIGDPKPDLSVSVSPVPSVWDGIALTGKTIDAALLYEHRLECTSCHDVHNLIGTAPASSVQLRIGGHDATGRNDLLCRTCHIK